MAKFVDMKLDLDEDVIDGVIQKVVSRMREESQQLFNKEKKLGLKHALYSAVINEVVIEALESEINAGKMLSMPTKTKTKKKQK